METETLSSNPRFARGLEIARRVPVRQLRDSLWSVASATHKGATYMVDVGGEQAGWTCTCPDAEANSNAADFRCKHVFAAMVIAKLIEVPVAMNEISTNRPTYKQAWPAYEAAQMHEREYFIALLGDLCRGIAMPAQTRGRPRKPMADIVFAACLRAYSGMSSRRAHSDVLSAVTAGFIDEEMHPKTVLRHLNDESLTGLLRSLIRESAAPLAAVERAFAIDSSGFSTCTYARWFDHKWGKDRKQQQWIKAHICVGVTTHAITDVIVTDGTTGDAPQLPELVTNTAQRFTISDVSADKAYSSHANIEAIVSTGASPFVPFKIGTTGEGPELWRKAWALFVYKNDEFKRHYHARSNVESTFSMIKRKFGGTVRAKNTNAQHNELLCKLLVHNLVVLVMAMFELGITADFWGARSTT